MTALYIGNDMMIRFSGAGRLEDDLGEAVTGATVQAVLYTKDTSDPVPGAVWPVTLSDQGDGEYSGTIPDTVEVVAGQRYDMVITAAVDGADAQWRKTVRASYRPFNI